MELDDLKSAWQAMDGRLERLQELNVKALREGKLRDARSALEPLRRGQWVQIAIGTFSMLLFAPFWVSHMDSLHLMLPGLLLHAYAIMVVLSAARTLFLIGRLDYSEPVVEIQRRLAELRLWRARVEQPLFAVIGCFIWIPLVLVAFEAVGVDVWARAPQVVYWDIACGFVCLAIVYAVVWRVRKHGSERARARLENSFVGNSVRRAERELDEIACYESEA